MVMHIYPLMDIYFLLVALILGGSIASFIMCVASRKGMPMKKRLTESSHCDSCGHRLGVFDLFPIFSWLLLRGSCRYCGAKIPKKAFLAEVGLGAFYALCLWELDFTRLGVTCAVLGTCVFAFLAWFPTQQAENRKGGGSNG